MVESVSWTPRLSTEKLESMEQQYLDINPPYDTMLVAAMQTDILLLIKDLQEARKMIQRQALEYLARDGECMNLAEENAHPT